MYCIRIYIGELIHDLEIVKIVKKLGLYCIYKPHKSEPGPEKLAADEDETLKNNLSSVLPSAPSDVDIITVFIHKSALSYTDPETDKDKVVTEDNITKLYTIGNISIQ